MIPRPEGQSGLSPPAFHPLRSTLLLNKGEADLHRECHLQHPLGPPALEPEDICAVVQPIASGTLPELGLGFVDLGCGEGWGKGEG